MHNFKELKVWQNAMSLTKAIYLITDQFPDKERFGLTSQIRRSAVSIPSNIAEGSGRGTDKDFVHFLHITFGSACELETQIILANELTYISHLQTEEYRLAHLPKLSGFPIHMPSQRLCAENEQNLCLFLFQILRQYLKE